MPEPIAEIIESSTRHFVAEVLGDDAPEFGAWTEVPLQDGTALFAVVAHVETGSVEPGRRAVALGMDRATLRREMPQVMALIRTTFRAQVLAYRDARGDLHQTLPPRPAALHDMVYPGSDDLVCALADARGGFDHLRALIRHPEQGVPTDDLLVSLLRRTRRAFGGGSEAEDALVHAGRALSRLLDDDHERLQSILRRIS